MVGCGALRCLNVSIKYKKQVDRYEKIVEDYNAYRVTVCRQMEFLILD